MRKVDSIISALPGGFEIVLADIGSAGGIKRNWRPFRPVVTSLLFEPREGQGEAAVRAGRDISYGVGLGAEPGRRRLNITALPNMSSLLEPNGALLERFRKKPGDARIVERQTIAIDTLDAIAARDDLAVDALKIDTQGTELDILKGAADSLSRSVLLAEVEVSFMERYTGQALFCEIQAFMDGKGFELVDLNRPKRYRFANRFAVGNISLGYGLRPGRLAYADAIFLLRRETLDERIAALAPAAAENLALKAVLLPLIYGKPDLAAQIFDGHAERIAEPTRAALARTFKSLGRAQYGPRGLHLLVEYLARQL